MKKPRVVVAGQIPPPYGGQNIMIEKAVAQFAASPGCDSVHLPFFFTADFQQARKAGFGKLLELARVIGRLLRLRARGPIDLLLYPSGGPQTVPVVRDILLLPWVKLCARRVVVHFHAAGIADRSAFRGGVLGRLLAAAYRGVAAAVVMTDYNRRDPEFFGIPNVIVRPHKIPDRFDPPLLDERGRYATIRLLYVGHLHPEKGTDALLRAFAALCRKHSNLRLELVGEPLPPWTKAHLQALIGELGIRDRIDTPGLLTGRAKDEAYGRAALFVFPTIAPYESFGLVLLEAMMWELPIVASNWRGNCDVLTPEFGGRTFDVAPPLPARIVEALEFILSRREEWPGWGKVNRAVFAKYYSEGSGDLWLADGVMALLPVTDFPPTSLSV